jgi:hypothetical protein
MPQSDSFDCQRPTCARCLRLRKRPCVQIAAQVAESRLRCLQNTVRNIVTLHDDLGASTTAVAKPEYKAIMHIIADAPIHHAVVFSSVYSALQSLPQHRMYSQQGYHTT